MSRRYGFLAFAVAVLSAATVSAHPGLASRAAQKSSCTLVATADCCATGAECCLDGGSACCAAVAETKPTVTKTAAKAADCCDTDAACCPGACCEEKAAAKVAKVADCCDGGECCQDGGSACCTEAHAG